MFYWTIRAIMRFLLRWLTRWEVIGLEHVPPHGPYILITNHLSYLDPPTIMASLPSRITVLAASKYKAHPFGLLLRLVNPVWIRRGEADRQGLRACLRVLAEGGILGLAPEGTRSKTGGLQPAKTGAAFLAVKADVPILPVIVIGTERALRDLTRLRRPHLRCVIGKPFRLNTSKIRSERRLEALTDEMMYRLAALLPPEYRGVYGGQLQTRRAGREAASAMGPT
jgi:1-acyl-sn-glycerol-3-phosphate acyltransferase